MAKIKKAVILMAGLGTRFLPLSKVVPKELWPLVDRPVIQYILEEAVQSEINEIIFVLKTENKLVLNYFASCLKTEKILKQRGEESILKDLKKIKDILSNVKISYVFQKDPLGDGHAILQAEKLIKKEPFAVLFADDLVESETPALLQISNVFKTCGKPVLSLYRLSDEKLSSYGIVGVEKIANRHYKVKEIIEKPRSGDSPSNFAIIGKYILTPDIFEYLKKTKPTKKKEIILANALVEMLKDGKAIYGHEIEGKWLECGNKYSWLESHLYLSLKDPEYGHRLKKFLKEII